LTSRNRQEKIKTTKNTENKRYPCQKNGNFRGIQRKRKEMEWNHSGFGVTQRMVVGEQTRA